MSEQSRNNWSNYWQGRTAEQVGDAMVGVGIERSAELAAFWDGALAGLGKTAKILDLACGAGSVLRHADRLGVGKLTGIDISKDAIEALKRAIPTAKGVVGPVDAMPFEDASFDMIVSQFGFEYAGTQEDRLATAKEIGRLLKPSGKFVAICHTKDGGIEREVGGHLVAIADLERCGFIEAARDVFKTAFALDAAPGDETHAAYQEASRKLKAPRDEITAWLKTGLVQDDQIQKLGHHLYGGTIDLFNRRKAYALEDIMGWLDGMQHEIDAYKGRMASMQAAALDREGCEAILAVLDAAGFAPAPLEHLFLGSDTEPAAWILKAG
jgi:SAM-dependent methyltransferase